MTMADQPVRYSFPDADLPGVLRTTAALGNKHLVTLRGGGFVAMDAALSMWAQIDLLSCRLRLWTLRTSQRSATVITIKPYAVIYDPLSDRHGDDDVVRDLAQLWAARSAKDYALADTIRAVIGGKVFIHSDCIEWLSIGEDGTWG